MTKQNTELGYHISMGADAKMYIFNNGEDYIKNLSTDYETAKIKAKEYLLKEYEDDNLTNEELKVPLDIWLRVKYVTPVYIPHTPDWLIMTAHVIDHKKHLEFLKEKELKDDGAKQSHIGTVEEKIENLELTITDIFTYVVDNPNGYPIITFGHKFEDKNNNHLIYFGNSKQFVKLDMVDVDWADQPQEQKVSIYNVGDKITVKGTIKDHTYEKRNEYMPLTIIKRPSVITKKEKA